MTKKTYTLIGLLVLLVILIVLAWKFNILPKGSKDKNGDQKSAENVPPALQKAAEEKGKLVTGMPASLVLNSSAIIDSYKISYTGADQYTTVFTTAKTIGSELVAYETALTKDGYKTVSKSLIQNSGNYYGTKDKEEVNVVVTQNSGEKTATVNVTYLFKK